MPAEARPLKIAQVAPLIYPVPPIDAGGTERVVADLCDGLCAAGHEVTLFAADGSDTLARLVRQGPAVATIPDAPPSMPGAMEAAMLAQVAAHADAFDIIHCHTEFFHAAALATCPDKVLMSIHWRADQADRQHFFARFPHMQVAAISAAQEADVPASNRLGVVHHGIDGLAQGSGHGGYCAFLGRMTDQKRPDRAIRIARAAGMPIRLAGNIDVGNPTYFEREVASRLGQDITHIGPITQSQKQGFLGNASVFLFPIDWPEPFGLVMIEAMACGTPVVAWNNGSVAEIVEDGVTGYVVETEREAVDAVRRAAKLDRATVRAGFERRFTRHRMIQGYLKIYRRMSEAVP
ncbi:glycosyltransferase family 4 protein [Oceaniglobus indicus]|uniref:glycosyltransferase family 4 protein n=1 Tax=Oceaniglobus indicus TaxID=2047749 RepID=UPI000C18882E|nr:glycosyltransferase family 4 protein [Oceaniglobus indicus]